ALSYSLSGSSQGAEVSVDATFSDTGVHLQIVQAGTTTTFELDSEDPFYVLDNNFVDGFQVLADARLTGGADDLDAAIVVPQVASPGRAVVRATGENGPIVSADERVGAGKLQVTISVLNQTVEVVLWVDQQGEIALLEQPIGAIRFERSRTATSAAAAAGPRAGAAGPSAPETAAGVLSRTAACVTVSKVEVQSAG